MFNWLKSLFSPRLHDTQNISMDEKIRDLNISELFSFLMQNKDAINLDIAGLALNRATDIAFYEENLDEEERKKAAHLIQALSSYIEGAWQKNPKALRPFANIFTIF